MHRSRVMVCAALFSALACGGESHHDEPITAGTGGHTGGGAGAGAAGLSGMGGRAGAAGAAGLSGAAGEGGRAGAAGQGGGGTSAFPCGDTTPVLDPDTGLERCSSGYVRRVEAGTCPSSVPRSDPIAGFNPDLDECERDADCSAASFGPYGHCGVRDGGYARACVSGCVTDADCDPGSVCFCGDPVGRCVSATCTTGDDCTDGFDCAAFESHPGCFSTELTCQTAADECGSDGDCADFSPNPAFCVVENGHRVCSIVQCTEP